MIKKTVFCLFLVVFLWGMVNPGLSQTAEGILEKMIEAQGGRKVIEKVEDMTLSGSIELIQMGMSGSITMYNKEPDKMRMDMEFMGMTMTQAYDGEIAWWINPQTGSTEEMDEGQTEDIRRQSLGNDSLLHPEKYGIRYSYKGKEKIEGKDYFVLEQTFSDGFQSTMYVDSGTYLTYKSQSTTVNQMGIEVEAETFLRDYKEIDGMMVPHTITTYQEGEEFMTMSVTEVSFNSGLEDSFFQMGQ